MEFAQRRAEATRLLEAYRTTDPIEPLIDRHPSMTLDDAYSIQSLQVEHWRKSGAAIRGHKVGLTSRAMQKQIGVDQPDFGVLRDDMFFPESTAVDTAMFLQPRVEPEIAFILNRELHGPGVTIADAIRAIAWVVPAIELIDSRIRDWRIGFYDTVADNASSGAVVLGSNARRLDGLDLRAMGCILLRNGRIIATGAGAAVLGSPLNALIWLANTLGERGVAIESGAVVLPGSITKSVPVSRGDVISARYSSLGQITVPFV